MSLVPFACVRAEGGVFLLEENPISEAVIRIVICLKKTWISISLRLGILYGMACQWHCNVLPWMDHNKECQEWDMSWHKVKWPEVYKHLNMSMKNWYVIVIQCRTFSYGIQMCEDIFYFEAAKKNHSEWSILSLWGHMVIYTVRDSWRHNIKVWDGGHYEKVELLHWCTKSVLKSNTKLNQEEAHVSRVWFFHRCLCWRNHWPDLCLHLLPAALPALPPHRVPPALRQPGCCPPTARCPGGGAAHRQCHQSASGGPHRGACMTACSLLSSPGQYPPVAPDSAVEEPRRQTDSLFNIPVNSIPLFVSVLVLLTLHPLFLVFFFCGV